MTDSESLFQNPYFILVAALVIVVLLVYGSIKLVTYLLSSTNEKKTPKK